MQSFQISDKKDFMNKLLNSDCFHSFLLKEATIHTAISYVIDGKINEGFYTKEEWEDTSVVPFRYQEWKEIMPLCFDLIKGKRTPIRFKFILYLKPEAMEQVLNKADITTGKGVVNHMILNIHFDNGEMSLTSGISYSAFTMDKDADNAWDKALQQFLSAKNITFSSEA